VAIEINYTNKITSKYYELFFSPHGTTHQKSDLTEFLSLMVFLRIKKMSKYILVILIAQFAFCNLACEEKSHSNEYDRELCIITLTANTMKNTSDSIDCNTEENKSVRTVAFLPTFDKHVRNISANCRTNIDKNTISLIANASWNIE